jgi:(S)-2-hydroxyglutarate dehydrogenase
MKSGDLDILIAGAGVLGVTLAYWISSLYDCTVALVDLAQIAGAHTSSRNTGVIHRPFYLDPHKKKIFARTSLVSHPMWEQLAKGTGLPWKPVGTFNVAVDEAEVRTIERYQKWGIENGMEEGEMELLDGGGVRSREPEVKCRAALLSKTDVSVDFGGFTRNLWDSVVSKGVLFLGSHRLASARTQKDGLEVGLQAPRGRSSVVCKLLINAAGGGALEIAHSLGLAREYAALNFRGEYWVVDEPFALRVTSNIYRPPRFPQYPFLDPHFVVRADGTRQIGPNAVVVPGPYIYSGIGLAELPSFLQRPIEPKTKLLMNRDFLSLLIGEWRSSLSKSAMCDRVKKFVPSLRKEMLRQRAVFGVRSSVLDSSGFVPEALLLKGESSAHIINFNSPGATGAPAFSAMVVDELRSGGMLERFHERSSPSHIPGWDFQTVTGLL